MKKQIHWRDWNEESLNEAKKENKPIFLSMGRRNSLQTEKMERTTFQNNKVIELLNERFIPIKIDSLKRPDIEKFYHKVYHLMNRQRANLPLSIFTTSDLKPFYAGSYIDLEAQESELGFEELLRIISKKYITDYETLAKKGEEVLEFVNPKNKNIEATKLTLNIFSTIINHSNNLLDKKYGGFGEKSKFHNTSTLELLLDLYELEKDNSLLKAVSSTLDAMYKSDLYDKTHGGFFHYSKKRDWSKPYRVKNIEENSQLSQLYLRFFYITNNDLYKRIAIETIDYLVQESINLTFTSQFSMFISALFKISEVDSKYQVVAEEKLQILIEKNYINGQLFHHKKNNIGGFLSDYAYLSQALLDAYQINLNENHLILVTKLVNKSIEQFYQHGEWKFTNGFFEIKEEIYDINYPSSLSTITSVLMTLSSLLDSNYKKFVFKTLELNSYTLMRQPLSSPKLSHMVIRYLKDDIIIHANESLLKRYTQDKHAIRYPFLFVKSTLNESIELHNSSSCLAKEITFDKIKPIIESYI